MRCTSTTGCAPRPTRRRATAGSCAGGWVWRRRWRSCAPSAPPGPATCRRGHASCAMASPIELARELDALIATGHTATDQVETILYRLAASPGRRALLGMSPREGRLVRPLLGLTREQTAAYCRARGLAWREDASNDDERYARARVRNASAAGARCGAPRGAAERAAHRAAAARRGGGARRAGRAELAGRARASRSSSCAICPPALARLVVIRLAEDAAGTSVPQAGAAFRRFSTLAGAAGAPSCTSAGWSAP